MDRPSAGLPAQSLSVAPWLHRTSMPRAPPAAACAAAQARAAAAPGVKPCTQLSEKERLFAARLQEAFAAMLDHTDSQIGRLVAFLKELGLLDDTLFSLMSDNGASQEGGPTGVLDEMRYFNGMREDLDAAVARLDDIRIATAIFRGDGRRRVTRP